MKDKVIESSRGKILLYLFGCLAFSIILWILVQDERGHDSWKPWLGVVFFGLGSLVFLALLIRPQQLVLDDIGFSLRGGFVVSPKKVMWNDVEEFFVWRLPRGGKSVGYRYRPGATNLPKMVKVNRAFGADGALPRAWPEGPDELVAELNVYRQRASAIPGQVQMSE